MPPPFRYNEKFDVHLSIEKNLHEQLREIASRENVSLIQLFQKIGRDYLVQHGAGNDTYKLQDFDQGLIRAYPTPWNPLTFTKEKLETYTKQERDEMKQALLRAEQVLTQIEREIDDKKRDQFTKIIQRRDHIQESLKQLDRLLSDPKQVENTSEFYLKRMQQQVRDLQNEDNKLRGEYNQLYFERTGRYPQGADDNLA
jgi:DNA mismatch repair ATPase MutS